ncbi:MAG: BamA/TamA family outer membrane protein, partial [Gammaproteobacteria bacterium]|nr:BamA/TamA family outer membrane protein [Gammaproteobacteria bacterium]
YSKVRTGILAEYRKPLRNPRTEWMSYTGAIESETTDTSESDLIRAGVRRSRQFAPNWLRTASLDVNYESFLIGTVDDNSLLVLPAIAFDNKEADQDLHPTHGRRLGLELRGTHRAIGSSTNFLQVVGRARFIRSFGTDSRLIARGTIGFTAKEEFDELPPSVRFFAGGDESIRGFNYKSLGPLDQDGNVVGGSNLLVASLEYERRLKGEFFGAVFVDGGNAFDGTEVDPAYGAGLGIKWRSPIGQLRFYLAHPLNKSDDSIKIHVSLGADL